MSRRSFAVLLAAGTGCVLTTDLDGFSSPPQNGADSQSPAESGMMTDGSADAGTTPTNDAAASDAAPDSNVVFSDDFNRADGPVGNGWLDPGGRYKIEQGHVP